MGKQLAVLVTGFGIIIGETADSLDSTDRELIRGCSLNNPGDNPFLSQEPLGPGLLDCSEGEVRMRVPHQVICTEARVPLNSDQGIAVMYREFWGL